MNLRTILEAGHKAQSEAKAAKEVEKRGKLRVGSAGAVCSDGEIRGTCHRVALLRKLGIEETPGLHTRIMWGIGEVSEINAERVLTAAGLTVDMQQSLKLPVGDEFVHGTPDVITEIEGQKYGIELKSIFSYNTAALVYLDRKPKNENLIQALTYGMAANLPWMLVYTNPNYFSVPFYDKKKTQLKSLIPFYAIFYTKWVNDVAYYRHEDEPEWTETFITKDGIQDYFLMVSEMEQKKELGPRYVDSYVNGDPSKWGDACKFCPFSAACNDWDNNKNFDDWIDNCKSVVSE